MTETAGMNPDEVEDLGRLLKSRATLIHDRVATIDAAVQRSSWIGADASNFKNQAWPKGRARLQQIANDLDGFGQSALNNAAEQRRASAPNAVIAATAAVGGSVVVGAQGMTWTPTPGGSPDNDAIDALFDIENDLSVIRDAQALLHSGASSAPGLDVGLGVLNTLHDGSTYGWGDAKTVGDEVNTIAGGLVARVPGGSIAWWLGTHTGSLIGNQLETTFNVSGKTLNFVYGDTNSMTVAQADAMVKRTSNPITYVDDIASAVWRKLF